MSDALENDPKEEDNKNDVMDVGHDGSSTDDERNDSTGDEDSDGTDLDDDDDGSNVDDEESNFEDEDTEEDRETETEDCDEEGDDDVRNIDTQSLPASPSADNCPICLNSMSLGQDIGTPDSCSNAHNFCLDCIEEWSANVSTCPVDRKPFTIILVKRELGGAVIEKIAVKNKSLILTHNHDDQHQMEDLDDLTFCEICGRCDHEDRLLLCDGCDFGYHCDCLSPPLEEVPIEEWFCPDCFQNLFGSRETSTARQEFNRLSTVRRGGRVIARTRALEAVRSRIERRRTAALSESEPETSTSTSRSQTTGSSSTAIKKRAPAKKTTTKRKTTKRGTKRRKRTTKQRSTRRTTKTGKKRKTRRRKRRKTTKRKSRRSLAASKRLPAPVSARDRIMEKLGMERKKALGPHSLPVIRKIDITARGVTPCSTKSHWSKNDMPSLSLTGSGMSSFGAVPLSSVIEEEARDYAFGGDVLATRASTVTSHSAILSSKAPPRDPDILSSILAGQEILHANPDEVVLTREGQLRLNRSTTSGVRKRTSGDSDDKSNKPSPEQKSSNPHANGNSESQQRKDTSSSSSYDGKSSSSLANARDQEEFMISKPTPSFSNSDIPLKKRKYDMDKIEKTPSSDIFSDIEPEQTSNDHETPDQKWNVDFDAQMSNLAPEITEKSRDEEQEKPKIEIFVDREKDDQITSESQKREPQKSSNTYSLFSHPMNSEVSVSGDSQRNPENAEILQQPDLSLSDLSSPINSPERHQDDKPEIEEIQINRSRFKKSTREEKRGNDEDFVDLTHDDENASNQKENSDRDVGRNRLSSMVLLKTESVSTKNEHSSSRDHSSRHHRSPRRDSRRDECRSDRRRSRERQSRDEGRWKHDKYEDRTRSRRSSDRYSSNRDRNYQGRERSSSPRRRSRWDEDDKQVSRRNEHRRDDRNSGHHSSTKNSRRDEADKRVNSREDYHWKTSGPKTPPDVLSKRNQSRVSDPPTPTMDEIGDNCSQGQDLSLMNVSGPSSRRESTANDIPFWLSQHNNNVASNSLQRPNLRVINTLNGSCVTNLSDIPVPSTSTESSSGQTPQIPPPTTRSQAEAALHQLLKNAMSVGILNKNAVPANVGSPDGDNDPISFDSAPFSPTDSTDMESPETGTRDADKSSLQSKVDKILIQAKNNASSQSSTASAASLFKKPVGLPIMSKEERRRKVKESLKKKLDEEECAAPINKKEEKLLSKLNRQERVVEEVKVSLKPVYQKKEISKDEYKEIMRRAVPKICHHKSGEINPSKIQGLVQKYIKQVKHERKKASRKTK